MKKILIIDDEESFLGIIQIALEQYGYECLGAPSGIDGYNLALKYFPDIVLCDVFMSGMNGFETLNAFRKNEELALIPFIFLTAHSDPSTLRYGMELGADDFLSKPFNPREVVSAVEARLNRHQILVHQQVTEPSNVGKCSVRKCYC